MRLRRESERGLTLWEVILALFIAGIVLVTSLRLLAEQWRDARALRDYLEAHYSILASGQIISDAIRTASTVEWIDSSGTLSVLPLPNDTDPLPGYDTYFIDDLDRDGIKDLYWRHLDVPSPLASYLLKWQCTEVEPGLWKIYLEAGINGQSAVWRGVVRQRLHPVSLAASGTEETTMPVTLLF